MENQIRFLGQKYHVKPLTALEESSLSYSYGIHPNDFRDAAPWMAQILNDRRVDLDSFPLTGKALLELTARDFVDLYNAIMITFSTLKG